MSPDNFREKLYTTYLNSPETPTPCQIQNHLSEQMDLCRISEETGIGDIGLLKKVFHPNGRFLEEKYRTFLKSMEELPSFFDIGLVVEIISPKCITSSGEIYLGRLKRLAKKSR